MRDEKKKLRKRRLACWLGMCSLLVVMSVAPAAALPGQWNAGLSYAVGDVVTQWVGNTPHFFKCLEDNKGISPLFQVGPFWKEVWPYDPAKPAGGDGPTGNDWIDFGFNATSTLFGLSGSFATEAISIYPGNIHRQPGNRNGKGDPVTYQIFRQNYGDVGAPTLAQGEAYWQAYYQPFLGQGTLQQTSAATNTYNCVSFAFNMYVPGALSTNWVNSGPDAQPFIAELLPVAAFGANAGAPGARIGDRCYNDEHVWTLSGPPGNTGGPTSHHFKNNSSPEFIWTPIPYSNATPRFAGLPYPNFAIGRRP